VGPAATLSEPLIQIALLGEAMQHVPVAVFVFDADGKYVAVNAHACKVLGYEREELLSHRIGDLAVDRHGAIHEYIAVAEGRAEEGTTRVRRSDGSEVRLHGAPTTIGGITFYAGVAWEA
jgi:PAS domain S-box-containing protein